jgi:hypothetical protein
MKAMKTAETKMKASINLYADRETVEPLDIMRRLPLAISAHMRVSHIMGIDKDRVEAYGNARGAYEKYMAKRRASS